MDRCSRISAFYICFQYRLTRAALTGHSDRRSSDSRIGSVMLLRPEPYLLSFPMAGFRRGSGLNAYSCGTAGDLTPFPHPEPMGKACRTPDSIKRLCSYEYYTAFVRKVNIHYKRNTRSPWTAGIPLYGGIYEKGLGLGKGSKSIDRRRVFAPGSS